MEQENNNAGDQVSVERRIRKDSEIKTHSQSTFTSATKKGDIRHLPIANVSRVMKEILDKETKISKESKECVQACVSDFISFITCEACEKCKIEKRKTINGDDLLYALEVFGFDQYVNILKIYLMKYRVVSFSLFLKISIFEIFGILMVF